MNFIDPEGFPVKGIESEGEAHEETEDKYKDFISFCVTHILLPVPSLQSPYSMGRSIPSSPGDSGSQRKRYMDASLGNRLKLAKLPSKYPFKAQGKFF